MLDEIILEAVNSGRLIVDTENGLVYSNKISKTKPMGSVNNKGYVTISLSRPKHKPRTIRAHRIIWIAAHGLPDPNLEIDHINRDKADNRIINLRLVDRSTNQKNKDFSFVQGSLNGNSKLKEEDVLQIRERLANGEYGKDLAKEFQVSTAQISDIKHKRYWRNV